MEVKRIFWTEFATNQLEQVFDYYKYKAGIKVAKKIVLQIVDRTILLETNPLIGTKEPLLENRKNEYRYLVEGNYKIIYFIEEKNIKISSIFDCRQNPSITVNSNLPSH
jgi:plasmid stabilization system protein ParE